MAPNGVVLVTGASGYLAASIVLHLLDKGYRVKATVRSQDKADAFTKKHPHAKFAVEWAIVQDLVEHEAFNDAVKGVDYIIHVASPFHFRAKDNELDILLPAVVGTQNILGSALTYGKIKRFVLTSSYAAVMDYDKGYNVGVTYTDDTWSPALWENSLESEDGGYVYFTSKKYAEQAAWSFMMEKKPPFSLVTICPPLIIGPPTQPISSMDKLNESVSWIWEVIGKGLKAMPPTLFPIWVDVRDCAAIHVDALTNPKAENKRYGTVAGHLSYDQVAFIVANSFPEQAHRIPPSDNRPPVPHYGTDSSRVESDFGIKWTSLEKCVTDMAGTLYALEKELALRA